MPETIISSSDPFCSAWVAENIVSSKLVFKLKHDADSNINRYKAWLIA